MRCRSFVMNKPQPIFIFQTGSWPFILLDEGKTLRIKHSFGLISLYKLGPLFSSFFLVDLIDINVKLIADSWHFVKMFTLLPCPKLGEELIPCTPMNDWRLQALSVLEFFSSCYYVGNTSYFSNYIENVILDIYFQDNTTFFIFPE